MGRGGRGESQRAWRARKETYWREETKDGAIVPRRGQVFSPSMLVEDATSKPYNGEPLFRTVVNARRSIDRPRPTSSGII
jgi:hypothetical protein